MTEMNLCVGSFKYKINSNKNKNVIFKDDVDASDVQLTKDETGSARVRVRNGVGLDFYTSLRPRLKFYRFGNGKIGKK